MDTVTAAASMTPAAAFLARQSAPLVGTESAALAIKRVSYSHDAMIDLLIQHPEMDQGSLARHFGYTQPWVSRIMNSDAFLARLAERKGDIVDPAITMTLDEKFRALAVRSLDIVLDKLELTKSPDMAFKALELSSKALGYGARQQNVNVQTNFVVAMPGKVETPEAWAEKHKHLSQRTPGLAAMLQEAVGEVTDV